MKNLRLVLCTTLLGLAQASHAIDIDANHGLTTLPALWDHLESTQQKAPLAVAALASLGLGGAAVYFGLKHTSCTPAQFAGAALLTSAVTWFGANATQPTHYWWQWGGLAQAQRLNPENLVFPKGFMFGTGTSSYQIEGVGIANGGNDTSTYAQEYRTTLLNNTNDPKERARLEKAFEKYEAPVGIACDQWNRYKEDAQLMQEKGFTTFRMSVERFKVEPQENVFNQDALNHYADVARELIKHNVRPLVGMHHYTDPQWFMEKGGFENEANLDGFARYCAKTTQAIYEASLETIKELKAANPEQNFDHLVPLFYTYNSSNAYAMNSYGQGDRPPYAKSLQRFAAVLCNMLEAHVRAYEAIKQVAPTAKVGTTINVYQLDAANHYNPIDRIKSFFGNHLMHDTVYNFFKDGVFKLWLGPTINVHYTNKKAPHSLDWVGLNYYSHGYLATSGGPFSSPPGGNDEQTANHLYTIYGEGLFRALQEMNTRIAQPLGIPIIITETGIGVGDDHTKRQRYLERYLYAASKACEQGIPLEGIMIWSFMDNYEWGTYTKRYGLFAVNYETQERTWRQGSQFYEDVIKKSKKSDGTITLAYS